MREPALIGLTSLRYVVGLKNIFKQDSAEVFRDGWKLRREDSGQETKFYVYENEYALPRAYLVNSYMVTHSERECLLALKKNIKKMQYSVVLENTAPSFPSADTTVNPGEARIKTYGNNKVELEARSDKSCLLILTDCYYPGWIALVDGEEKPILRANSLFRAVEVPPGDHTIVFRYRPKSLHRGIAISLATLMLILAGLFVQQMRARIRKKTRAEDHVETGATPSQTL